MSMHCSVRKRPTTLWLMLQYIPNGALCADGHEMMTIGVMALARIDLGVRKNTENKNSSGKVSCQKFL